jgi:hypothetical protein
LDSIELNSLTGIEKKDLPRVIDRVKYNYNYNYAHPSIILISTFLPGMAMSFCVVIR